MKAVLGNVDGGSKKNPKRRRSKSDEVGLHVGGDGLGVCCDDTDVIVVVEVCVETGFLYLSNGCRSKARRLVNATSTILIFFFSKEWKRDTASSSVSLCRRRRQCEKSVRRDPCCRRGKKAGKWEMKMQATRNEGVSCKFPLK